MSDEHDEYFDYEYPGDAVDDPNDPLNFDDDLYDDDEPRQRTCVECDGTGMDWEGGDCPHCDGYGYYWWE